MNRAPKSQAAQAGDQPPNPLGARLSLIASALLGAVLATAVLATADSVSINSGESLAQVLLIFITATVASLAGWQVWPWHREQRLQAGLLLAAVLILVVSCLSATWNAEGRPAWNNFWHILALLLFAMTTAQAAREPQLAQALLRAVILCAVFQATFALHQYFVSMPQSRAEYLADPDGTLMRAKIDAPPVVNCAHSSRTAS